MVSETSTVKRVFISDIHMGDDRSVAPGGNLFPYGWFRNLEAPNENRPEMLNSFLKEHVLQDDTIDELIILGDLFDEWICPADFDPIESPPADQFFSIARASQNAPVIASLATMAKANKLIYVSGNHDMLGTEGASKKVISDILPGVRYIGAQGQGSYVTDDGIIAEHGHAYTLFNAPWADRSGQTGFDASILPLGFFISRLDAQYVSVKNQGYNFWDFVWDALRHVLMKELAKRGLEEITLFEKPPETVDQRLEDIAADLEDVIDKLLIDCFRNFYSDDVFAGQDGVRLDGLDGIPGSVAWQEIDRRYAELFSGWKEFHPSNVSAFLALINDLGNLESAAQFIMEQQQKSKIVIFGHTHNWKLQDHLLGETKHIYANSGTWINHKPCTVVITEFHRDSGEHTVGVWEYKAGDVHLLKKASVTIIH
jgi:UDP-2,3-diacylglucosamine pyrophosphatase LpxH